MRIPLKFFEIPLNLPWDPHQAPLNPSSILKLPWKKTFKHLQITCMTRLQFHWNLLENSCWGLGHLTKQVCSISQDTRKGFWSLFYLRNWNLYVNLIDKIAGPLNVFLGRTIWEDSSRPLKGCACSCRSVWIGTPPFQKLISFCKYLSPLKSHKKKVLHWSFIFVKTPTQPHLNST